jgi:hypothetical protein
MILGKVGETSAILHADVTSENTDWTALHSALTSVRDFVEFHADVLAAPDNADALLQLIDGCVNCLSTPRTRLVGAALEALALIYSCPALTHTRTLEGSVLHLVLDAVLPKTDTAASFLVGKAVAVLRAVAVNIKPDRTVPLFVQFGRTSKNPVHRTNSALCLAQVVEYGGANALRAAGLPEQDTPDGSRSPGQTLRRASASRRRMSQVSGTSSQLVHLVAALVTDAAASARAAGRRLAYLLDTRSPRFEGLCRQELNQPEYKAVQEAVKIALDRGETTSGAEIDASQLSDSTRRSSVSRRKSAAD